jgi:hypothetical protein
MTKNIDSKEMLEMKEQLSLLIKKLDKETIVNERMIRRSMKEKADRLNRRLIVEILVCLIMIPFFICVLPNLSKVSMPFCIFSAGFFALGVLYDFYMYLRFRPQKFIEGNMIEARRDTLNFKKQTLRWTYCIGIPFLVVYIAWFVYEKMQYYQGEILKIVLVSALIGFLIGGAIGINIFLKDLRATDEILMQIEELEEKV